MGDFFEEAVVEEEVWSDRLVWFDGSRKLRKDGRVEREVVEVEGVGVGETLGILGTIPFSFFGSISLLTHERIFSLSSLVGSCDYHVTVR